MAERRSSDTRNGDHDLLVRVDERLRIALEKIEKLTDSLTEGLSKKLDSSEFQIFKMDDYDEFKQDHERRVRKLETWAWTAIGALALIELVGFAYIMRMFG